jgi:hypothetical protein
LTAAATPTALAKSAAHEELSKFERNLAKWAGKARKTVSDTANGIYDAVPQRETPGDTSSSEQETGIDLESGSDSQVSTGSQSTWASWASSASSAVAKLGRRVATEAEKAKAGIEEAAEKATWADQAKSAWNQSDMKGHLKQVTEGIANAGAALHEKRSVVVQKTAELSESTQQKLKEASSLSAEKAREAKDKAAQAAGAAKGAAASVAGAAKDSISSARENIVGTGALLASPAKLAQFLGAFLLGSLFITSSISFLPILPIAPQKFALLFAFGSMILLSSFAVLKGPTAFFGSLTQRDKLPFSGSYAVGVVGTLIATIGLRSYILTAFFRNLASHWPSVLLGVVCARWSSDLEQVRQVLRKCV